MKNYIVHGTTIENAFSGIPRNSLNVVFSGGKFQSSYAPLRPKPKPAPPYTPSVYNAGTGQVVKPQILGSSTRTVTTPPPSNTLGVQPPSSGGQSGGGQSNFNDLLEQQQEQPSIDFDALIAPAISALESQIAPLEQSAQTDIGNINAKAGTELERNKQNLSANLGEVDTAEAKQTRLGESAVDEQRRDFSEIQQGLQALYGKTTGTGAFASELAGRQAMRNIGDIRTGLTSALEELTNKRIQIRDVARLAETEIENDKKTQIANINKQLSERKMEINSQVGLLYSRKAEMYADALRWAQQQKNEINARNTAFKQQLYVQQQEADQRMKELYAKGKQAVDSISIEDLDAIRRNNPWLFTPGSNTKLSGNVDVGGGKTASYSIGAPELTDEDERQKKLKKLIDRKS